MKLYLLDTNTCVEVLRNRNLGTITRYRSCRPNELRMCSVVLGELFYGALRSANPFSNFTLVQTFSWPIRSLPFDDSAADAYAHVRTDLEKNGQPIGPNDTMIAAIAMANGLTLVTHNTAEFSRVKGLQLENWHS